MFSAITNDSTQVKRRTIFQESAQTEPLEVMQAPDDSSAESEPMLQNPLAEYQYLPSINQASVDEPSIDEFPVTWEQAYLAEMARKQAAQFAQLAELRPVEAACFVGRWAMLPSMLSGKPMETLFKSNLVDDGLDDEDLRKALINGKSFDEDERLQISKIFHGPIFRANDAGLELISLARDFTDNFRLQQLQTTEALVAQMNMLGASKFLKLQQVMLRNSIANAMGLQALQTGVKLKIESRIGVSYSMAEVLGVLGDLFKDPEASQVFYDNGISERYRWELNTGLKTLLTFFANYLDLGDSLPNGTIDGKINYIVESLVSTLIEDANSLDVPFSDASEQTGCLIPVDLTKVGKQYGTDSESPLGIVNVFLARSEQIDRALAAYGAKLAYLVMLASEDTQRNARGIYNRAVQQLTSDRQNIEAVATNMRRLSQAVGDAEAAYLLNIQSEGILNSVSFESFKNSADLAGRLADLYYSGTLEDTPEVVSVLSALGIVPSIRFLNMLVAHANGGRFELSYDKGKIANGNAMIELGDLFERLHSSFQHSIWGGSNSKRLMAQDVLSVLEQKNKPVTMGAFFHYLKDQYQQQTKGIVQRYMVEVPGCTLQRTMIESLGQGRLDKVDQIVKSLWSLNHSSNDLYGAVFKRLHVPSRIKASRGFAERNFKTALYASNMSNRSERESLTAPEMTPDDEILAFLNNVIKFQSVDAKRPGIDLKAFSDRKAVIRDQVDMVQDPEEKTRWGAFSQFYSNCESLARAVVKARKNNNMPWGARMALLDAETDLKTLHDICDDIKKTDFSALAWSAQQYTRDPRITEIMDLLVGDEYNFQWSDQEAVRTSLRRVMMRLEARGEDLENLLFESNALDARLAVSPLAVTQSLTYTGSPETLNVQLANLAEVQRYVFWQLPSLLSRPPEDPARLYSEILVPLERMTQALLPQPECPIIKKIHRETVGLLNYAFNMNPGVLNPITASIFARNEVRERPDTDAALLNIIDKTERLVAQLVQSAYASSSSALNAAALTLLEDVLPLMYDDRFESPVVQTALEMLNHARLLDRLPSLVRQAENDVQFVAEANTFKAAVEAFTDFKSVKFPDVDTMLTLHRQLSDLPEDAEPWVQSAVSQKLMQARRLMQPPEDIEVGATWSDRVDLLTQAVTRSNMDVLEIVAPEIQAAKGVNSRYLYLDDDISTLIQNAIDKSERAAENEAVKDQDQRRLRAQAVTLAPSAVGTVETLKDRVEEWLANAIVSEKPCIHILPYNPANLDGSNSLHWTAIILHLSAEKTLTVNYVNPLYANSPIPPLLTRDMTEIVLRFDQDAQTALAQQIKFVPIQHSSQDDATSCGPRIVADVAQIIEQWRTKGVVPIRLPVINDVDALRHTHLEALGGLDSEFGQRQLWNLIYADGADLDEKAIRDQDRLKEVLLDDILKLHAENPANFEVIKSNPTEAAWRKKTKNSTIKRLINVHNLVTPDQLVKSAVESAEKIFAMQSAFESLYEKNIEIVGDFIALKQMAEASELSYKQLAARMREIMTSYINDGLSDIRGNVFGSTLEDAERYDHVIRGFYPNFQGIQVEPSVADLAGEIDTLRKVLPVIDLAKTGYLKKALAAYVEADGANPVDTFELIQGLKEALKASTDASMDESLAVTEVSDVNACWQLMQRQIDTQGDNALLRALYPEVLRAQSNIPKVYGDALKETLSKIDLRASTRVGEVAKILQTLRLNDMPLYRELFYGDEKESVSDRLRDRYLSMRNALAIQEAPVSGMKPIEGKQVAGALDGVHGTTVTAGLDAAQMPQLNADNEKNKLLPLIQKVFVNFDERLSDDEVRALHAVPSDMINMAVSQARYMRRPPRRQLAYGGFRGASSWFSRFGGR